MRMMPSLGCAARSADRNFRVGVKIKSSTISRAATADTTRRTIETQYAPRATT